MAICADCGFLALRHAADGGLVEADARYRTLGTLPQSRGDEFVAFDKTPMCFARKTDFHERFFGHEPDAPDIVATLGDVVECEGADRFTPWQQGFTPRERREMLDRHRLLELEESREKDRRLFEERLAKMGTKPQWWMVWLAAGSMLVALGGLAVAALALR